MHIVYYLHKILSEFHFFFFKSWKGDFCFVCLFGLVWFLMSLFYLISKFSRSEVKLIVKVIISCVGESLFEC